MKSSPWRSLLTHPLLHFVVAGVVLYFWLGRPDPEAADTGDRSREIVITEGRIDNLFSLFEKTWQRPPTAQEIKGLIDDFIREEIYYREAIALGLDRDDTIIRRRMRQKIEFLTEDLATPDAADDETLAAYLAEQPERYRKDARYTLRQVFLDPSKSGADIEARAAELIATLEAESEITWTNEHLAQLGDGLAMLGNRHENASEFDLKRSFGEEFAAALGDLPVGAWSGPVRSGYGLHVVRIDERTEGRIPSLDEVRDAVLRDWGSERRREANEALYESLFHRYTITIERADGTRRVLEAPTPPSEPTGDAAPGAVTSTDRVPSP